MHFLSDMALWESFSEFVTPDGKISNATGESQIIINDNKIENRSWVMLNGLKITNFYSIIKNTETNYTFLSENPSLGIQKGIFSIDRNIIFSKFRIENSDMNGFEVIIRDNDICKAYGALYNGNELVNSWQATLKRKEK